MIFRGALPLEHPARGMIPLAPHLQPYAYTAALSFSTGMPSLQQAGNLFHTPKKLFG